MQDFQAFYEQATGRRPHEYQVRIARDGLPDIVRAPAGAGKPGVILAWLWRRLHGQDPAGNWIAGGRPSAAIRAWPAGGGCPVADRWNCSNVGGRGPCAPVIPQA